MTVVTLNVKKLNHYLTNLCSIINEHDAIPMLRYIRFKNGILTATDLDIVVDIEIPELKYQNYFSCTIEYRPFKDYIKSLASAKRETVKLETKDNIVVVNDAINYETLPVDDYPYLKPKDYKINYDFNDMPEVMDMMLPFAASVKHRPAFSGVMINGLTAIATNGYICNTYDINVSGLHDEIMIPQKTAKLISKIKTLHPIHVNICDTQIQIKYENITIRSKLHEAKYTLVETVINYNEKRLSDCVAFETFYNNEIVEWLGNYLKTHKIKNRNSYDGSAVLIFNDHFLNIKTNSTCESFNLVIRDGVVIEKVAIDLLDLYKVLKTIKTDYVKFYAKSGNPLKIQKYDRKNIFYVYAESC